MTQTPRRRRFGSSMLDRLIIVAIVASAAILGLGAYGILALGSHDDVLPYRIAFASSGDGREGSEDIVVLGLDGQPNQLTSGENGDGNPAWSPDGKKLIFARNGAVWINDSSGTRQLSDTGSAASFPLFSLDGAQIAYANEIDRTPNLGFVWLMSADGTNQHPIFTSDDPNAKPPACFGGYPGGWYPGSSRILYRGSFSDGSIAICSVNADGTDVLTVLHTSDGKLNFSPALSPDGTRIAFVSNRDGKDHIFLMNPEGGDSRLLFDDTGNDESPAWSPDGAWLTFSSDRDGRSHIYMIHPDGSGLTQLTSGASRDVSPVWAANAP